MRGFFPTLRRPRSGQKGQLVDLAREITIYDLLTHTAGFSYGGYEETGIRVDKLYDDADLDNIEISTEEMVRRIASLPLMYHPGEKWFYSWPQTW